MKPNIIVAFAVVGILIGVASCFGVLHSGQESLLWLVIGLAGAIWISGATTRRFLTGFLGGLVAGTLNVVVEAVFINSYLAHNPKAAASFAMLPKNMSPQVLCLVIAPFYGAVSGVVLGFLSWLAGKLRPKPQPAA